jgi:hypothetical protein
MALFLELESIIDVHLCDAEFRLRGILQCGDDGTRSQGISGMASISSRYEIDHVIVRCERKNGRTLSWLPYMVVGQRTRYLSLFGGSRNRPGKNFQGLTRDGIGLKCISILTLSTAD